MLYRNFSTQAQIDAQYNPSLGLAPGAAPMQALQAQAGEARQRLRCTLDVPYGPTLAETLDIFPADLPQVPHAPHAPVLVFLHGGYWRALSSKDFSGVALGLVPRGVTTVVVNYALCPAVTIDEITRQCRAALAWVLRNIGAHGGTPGGDASRVAIAGHSAGAHLAAMALNTPWQADYGLPDDPFAAGLLFSGLYDLAPLRYSYLQPMVQIDEGVVQRQSPLRHVRRCATPVWCTWGSAESAEFARQSATQHAAWLAAGNSGRLEAMDNADHFSVIAGLCNPASPACDWLVENLGATAP